MSENLTNADALQAVLGTFPEDDFSASKFVGGIEFRQVSSLRVNSAEDKFPSNFVVVLWGKVRRIAYCLVRVSAKSRTTRGTSRQAGFMRRRRRPSSPKNSVSSGLRSGQERRVAVEAFFGLATLTGTPRPLSMLGCVRMPSEASNPLRADDCQLLWPEVVRDSSEG